MFCITMYMYSLYVNFSIMFFNCISLFKALWNCKWRDLSLIQHFYFSLLCWSDGIALSLAICTIFVLQWCVDAPGATVLLNVGAKWVAIIIISRSTKIIRTGVLQSKKKIKNLKIKNKIKNLGGGIVNTSFSRRVTKIPKIILYISYMEESFKKS